MPITPKSERFRRVIMGIRTVAAGIVAGNAKYNFPLEGWIVALMAVFLVFSVI